MFVAIVLVAGTAIGAALRPLFDEKPASAPPAPTYTQQHIDKAATKVCGAFDEVRRAVNASAGRDQGIDPTAQFLYRLNGRQALLSGSVYLMTTLSEEPAATRDLAAAVRRLAETYQELTVKYVTGVNESEFEPLRRTADEATATIERLCK
jgi:hypothetical protein